MADLTRVTQSQMPFEPGAFIFNGYHFGEWAARYFTEEGHTDEDKAVPGYRGRVRALVNQYEARVMKTRGRRDK